ELWEYRHDASGRRTEKRCDRKKIRFTYLWDGDSIAEIREYRDDKLYSVRHLVFNGFELISQQFSRVRQPHPSVAPQWVTRTNYAVSDLTGRPLMLFNSEGKTVWRPGQTSLWGLALSLPADTDYPDPRGELAPEAAPGLLYAGQWQDTESGLCYNRFRYYEPETGMYLVSDPLGLQGGEQTYRYVPNPNEYIDSLGLVGCPRILAKNMRAANKELAKTAGYVKLAWHKYWGSAAHHIVAGADQRAAIARDILKRAGIDIDDAANGIFLRHIKKISPQQGPYHRVIHTDIYYREVERILQQAERAAGGDVAKLTENVKSALDDIRDALASGVFRY
ncbi:TPA: RHS repeat-associated core domain-containing protein, partial [Escherichia coli]